MKSPHLPKVGWACSGWGPGVRGGACHEWHGFFGVALRAVLPESLKSADFSWPKTTAASSCFASG